MDELTQNEEELYDLDDEAMEAAFKEAKAELASPDTQIEEDNQEVEEVEEVVEKETIEDNDEEGIEEDLEHPDEDSDDNSDENEVKKEPDEDSEDEEGKLDGEPEATEEQTEEDKKEAKDELQPIEKLQFKANGQDFEFTVDEMKEQFGRVFGQAMNYTQKMQQMKPDRKKLDAIQQAGLSDEDVNLAIELLKGDKDAITSLIKRTGIDTLDLDVENSKDYQPQDYGRNETELALKDIEDEISRDPEYKITHNVLTKQWDDKSWNEMASDPSLIKLLHVDVKSGMYDKINPIAQKLKVYGNGSKSDLDYYKEAAGQYFAEQDKVRAEEAKVEELKLTREQEEQKLAGVKAKQEQRQTTKAAAVKRKAAAPSKSKAGTKKTIDYLDESDEAFEEWYSKLQDSL